MVITLKGKHSTEKKVACYLVMVSYDKKYKIPNTYRAYVYESENGCEWKASHKSQPYTDQKKAEQAYSRFCRKYM